MEATQTSLSEAALLRKFVVRAMPVLALAYFVAWMDRQNIAFAKLQMAGDLHLTEVAFGFGASLFFIGYMLFEIPSNLVLPRFGAGVWFGRIMLTWGLATIALGFTTGTTMFYICRFLVGVCEAGFFPGVLFYMTLWVPVAQRSRMQGIFISAGFLANVIGGPICGYMLDLSGVFGLAGWQWVFFATGAPAVILGILMPFLLPSTPQKAAFYDGAEKARLAQILAAERATFAGTEPSSILAAALNGRVLITALMFFSIACASYGFSYWLPTVIRGFGVSNTVNGWLAAIPWLVIVICCLWLPVSSARRGKRTLHIMAPMVLGAVALLFVPIVENNSIKLVLLCMGGVGMFSTLPMLWTIPSTFMSGTAVAVALAVASSVASLGGFVAQNVVPWIKTATDSNLAPMFFVSAALALAAVLALVMTSRSKHRASMQSA